MPFPENICRHHSTLLYSTLLYSTLLYSTLIPSEILAQVDTSTGAPPTAGLNLPLPGTMVKPTIGFNPTLLVGVKVYPDNPFRFDFIVDTGEDKLQGEELKAESTKLIKYFLASLTVPENELWVNLSPYEKDRIIPEKFGITEMGKDLLAQDYLLKQLTASLIYPEDELGKSFWNKIYQKAYELYGTTNIPINTFNKVWIIPDNAVVYQNKDVAFVVESHLKVMLEGDYLALQNNLQKEEIGTDKLAESDVKQLSDVSSQIVKDVILPAIEKEVNEGKNFAQLRQIYSGLVLAAWYKKRLKGSILAKVYADKNKVIGVDVEDKEIKDKIYDQYVEAFKQGVYNYIKDDEDHFLGKTIKRRYVSGGFTAQNFAEENLTVYDEAQVATSTPLKQRILGGFRKILNPIMIVGASLLLPNTVDAQTLPQQSTVINQSSLGQINSQISPNPFEVDTKIKLDLSKQENVKVEIFNIKGQKVISLLEGVQEAGPLEISWDGLNDSGQPVDIGLYFVRVQVGSQAKFIKLLKLGEPSPKLLLEKILIYIPIIFNNSSGQPLQPALQKFTIGKLPPGAKVNTVQLTRYSRPSYDPDASQFPSINMQDVFSIKSLSDLQEIRHLVIGGDPKAISTLITIIDGNNDYSAELRTKALIMFSELVSWKIDVDDNPEKTLARDNILVAVENLFKRYENNDMPEDLLANAINLLSDTRIRFSSSEPLILIKNIIIKKKDFVTKYGGQKAVEYLVEYNKQAVIDAYFGAGPQAAISSQEAIFNFLIMNKINDYDTYYADQDSSLVQNRKKIENYFSSPYVINMARDLGFNKSGRYSDQISRIALSSLIEYGGTTTFDEYFNPAQIGVLNDGEMNFYLRMTNEISYRNITKSQKDKVLNFWKGVLSKYSINDKDTVFRILSTLDNAGSSWGKAVSGAIENMFEKELAILPLQMTPESFWKYAKIYNLYREINARYSDVSIDRIESRFKTLKMRNSIDQDFVDVLTFNNFDDFTLAIDFVRSLYKEESKVTYIYRKLFSSIGAQSTSVTDLEKLENMRRKINKFKPTLGDSLVLNFGTTYLENKLNKDRRVEASDIEQSISMAESLLHPKDNIDMSDDVKGLYSLVGNFILSRVVDHINRDANGMRDKLGEDKFTQVVNSLMKNGFFIDETGSNLSKIMQNFKKGNIRYLFYKATAKASRLIEGEKPDINPNDYVLQESSEYKLEAGANVVEIRKKEDQKDVLAYVVKVDPKQGGRFELSSDIGMEKGGVSRGSLIKEIGNKGRLLIDFPVSFMTGENKPTEILIEDGEIKNYLISIKGKDGFIIVYEDRTVHIADKRNLWVHDIVPRISPEKDKRLDILNEMEDYIEFMQLARDAKISLTSNMLLYTDGKITQIGGSNFGSQRLFAEFSDGTFGVVNPMENMSTEDAVKLAIIAGAVKTVYLDTGQFDFVTFHPVNADPVNWGDSGQRSSTNRIGIYKKSDEVQPPVKSSQKTEKKKLSSATEIKGFIDRLYAGEEELAANAIDTVNSYTDLSLGDLGMVELAMNDRFGSSSIALHGPNAGDTYFETTFNAPDQSNLRLTSRQGLQLKDSEIHITRPDAPSGDQAVLTDRASIGEQKNPGGIDLNPTNLDLQIKGEGMDFNLFYDCPEGTVQFNADKCTPRNSEQLQNLPIPGLYPVILNVTPMTNLPFILGISEEDTSEENNLEVSFQKSPATKEYEIATVP